MDDILGLSIEQMAGISFDCSCGRHHSVDIRKIKIGKNVQKDIIDAASQFSSGSIFLVADNYTYEIYGSKVYELLAENGYNIKRFIFGTNHPLIPDEKAMGRLLVEIEKGTSLIIAVGSGSLNDLARIMSFKLGIPYIIIGTAPSMDGYASTVSPLIIDGFKKTYEAVYPVAIIADTDVLRNAPQHMLHAGFGDILGKLTALADWELSRKLHNEYYCETSVKLVKNALEKCIENADGISRRDESAIQYLMEALILSGIAMGLVGNSRPASGAEHHMAHYWEMDALSKGIDHPLHGNCVGAAAVVMSSIYELMQYKLPAGVYVPEPGYVRALLVRAGAHDDPASLGIGRDLFINSVIHAREVRPRYTILQNAYEADLLEKFAEILARRFYE